MELLESIKSQLRPDTSILKEIERFAAELNTRLKEAGIKARMVPGGSVAKGTFLKGDFDVDLFAMFDYSYRDKNISELLGQVLEGYGAEVLHGSRDYFQLKRNELSYEIVPVLDVKDPALAPNVTDMSPMHVEWVKKHLKEGGADEIRLAKKFCKAAGVYGAESYIRGFSGHVIDILIIHYGSFLKLLEASQKWKAPVVIDTEKHYSNNRDVLFSINQSKIEGPLIAVDPILKSRNASSAMSYEKFAIFKKKAAGFLKNPSEGYFVEEKVGKTSLKKRFMKNIFILSFEAKDGKKDVIGGRILKAFKIMKSDIENIGFEIKDSGWSWNGKKHVLFWFVLKDETLPVSKVVEGPPESMTDHALEFRKKYTDTFTKEGKLFARVINEKRDALDVLKGMSESQFVRERIRFVSAEKAA